MPTINFPANWLRTFEIVARHLSLTRAAQDLHVTAAAVSQQIRLLERRVGAPLFIRHARGLRLTRYGEALLPPCRESFRRLESAVADLFGSAAGSQLVIRVPLGFAWERLLRSIDDFTTKHPDITPRVLASVWSNEPFDSTVDVDIRIAETAPTGRECHQLTRDQLFPVCSPRLARRLRLRQPADLKAVRLYASIGFAEGWTQWFRAANVRKFEPLPRIEFDSMRLAVETAALGTGVALARTSYVEDLLRKGKLCRLFEVELPASDNLFMVMAPNLGSSAPAARFRDWWAASLKS